jgi:AraC-like DNA-binding protein
MRPDQLAIRTKYAVPRRVGRQPRFTPTEAERLRTLHAEGWSYGRLAREFNASRSLVTRYVRDGFTPWRWAA